MPKTRRLQVLVEDEQWRRLERAASERGVSVASIVREAIDERLPRGAERRRAAADALLEAAPMGVPEPDDLLSELDELHGRRV